MRTKITSKYQVTIPKEIRQKLKLRISDVIDWKIVEQGVIIESVEKPFLKYKGYIKIGSGNLKEDINVARKKRALKYS